MNHRLASAFAFTSTCLAATLAAAVMTGTAHAEGPILQEEPFVSSRTRAEVRAELMSNPAMASSAGIEWVSQFNHSQPMSNTLYTRAQAQAEYIASRDQVQAMNAEHGGTAYFAAAPARTSGTVVAGRPAR